MDPDISCQRWRGGGEARRNARERIDPARHEVHLIGERDAKGFVERHHYARSYPAARLRVGLFRKERNGSERLAGAAVFSVPMNGHAVRSHTGVPAEKGVELGRFVLLDEVEGNGESWFLARALALLKKTLPEIDAVLSYSDPVPRLVRGTLVKPGHVGLIYQASNFVHLGRARARTLLVARADGTVVSERALSKIRAGARGREYAMRQLRALGAPPERPGEAAEAYLRRAFESDAFATFRHPGNHVYAMIVGDREARSGFAERARPGFPRPKQPDAPWTL